MARPKGSKNKTKDNGADETQERDADATETMAARTLRGDIRDELLREFKTTPVAWSFMKEDEQERVILRCSDIAEKVVNRAVQIAAAEGVPHVVVDVVQWTVKDGVKVVLTTATDDGLMRGPAVLAFADANKFKGQRKAAKPDVVGSLRMPLAPEPPGVHGDELPPDPTDPGPIPPTLRRLPPPSDGNRPDVSNPPFNDFGDDGPRHL